MVKPFNRILTIGIMLFLFLFAACAGESEKKESTNTIEVAKYQKQMEKASSTPFGKYPELITYTLGKLSGSNNSNLPTGDTYEDNAYTRFLVDFLNVQNQNVFEKMDNQYDSNVSMAISSGKIPDIMTVSSQEDLRLLVKYDMIADLTDSFENCMSDTIREIYNSYDKDMLDAVTFDGKIRAIPETNIEDGPNLVWLRKDWMEKLGMSDPKNLEDVEYIVSQFMSKNPGGNAAGQTVGLVCDPKLSAGIGFSNEYMLDLVFASFGAFPKQWIADENKNAVYGSTTPEAREALIHINKMYRSGILDNQFLLRTSSNIIELITNGQCGSFFGPWWAPNNPLMQAIKNDPDANWMPYLIATDDNGSTGYYSKKPTYKYVVVRKEFEHPEIACKIISALFDYARYEEKDNKEFGKYYQDNVDPTARPIAINVDYSNALSLCYTQISAALNGQCSPKTLNLLEYSYYETCSAYLKNKSKATPEEWAAYTSRITACKLLSQGKLHKVKSLFYKETDTMVSEWWKLEELEEQVYLQIVTGDLPISAFDDFVNRWKSEGGDIITQEVREELSK